MGDVYAIVGEQPNQVGAPIRLYRVYADDTITGVVSAIEGGRLIVERDDGEGSLRLRANS